MSKTETVETVETVEISIEAFKAARKSRSGGNWNGSIVAYLKQNQGSPDIKIYDATRPDRLDIPDSKKRHNLASQFTYLADAGYLVTLEDDKRFLVTEVVGKAIKVVPGQEARARALGLIKK